MNKEQFIAELHKKLHVIEENERQDIIDEYINHIDMKVQEGKSEEEAIEDFGDIDELVKDILDAYKINTSNQGYGDERFNHLLDDIFEKFKAFVSSFTSLDVDDVVKFVFEIFVILILLMILKIPFSMVSSLGSSLLRDIIGLGVGTALATVWRVLINLAYVVVFVVVLFSTCSKRINRYRNNEDTSDFINDFKESLRFEKKTYTHKENPYSTDTEQKYTKAAYTERPHEYENRSKNSGASSVVSLILKIFSIFLLMPFFGVIIGLCIALGILISLGIHGVTFIGGFFIIIGCLIGACAFVSLIFRTIWKGGSL